MTCEPMGLIGSVTVLSALRGRILSQCFGIICMECLLNIYSVKGPLASIGTPEFANPWSLRKIAIVALES